MNAGTRPVSKLRAKYLEQGREIERLREIVETVAECRMKDRCPHCQALARRFFDAHGGHK